VDTSIVEEVVASLIWIEENFAEYIAPLEEHCHNSKNTTFQERGKTTGQDDAIASKERHFSPSRGNFRIQKVVV
jgi:hypothetical protein